MVKWVSGRTGGRDLEVKMRGRNMDGHGTSALCTKYSARSTFTPQANTTWISFCLDALYALSSLGCIKNSTSSITQGDIAA
jgi:hypothetical protein